MDVRPSYLYNGNPFPARLLAEAIHSSFRQYVCGTEYSSVSLAHEIMTINWKLTALPRIPEKPCYPINQLTPVLHMWLGAPHVWLYIAYYMDESLARL